MTTMLPANTCVLCSERITRSTDSAEHILLQALGGRRQVRGFLCKQCNSRAGSAWDADLVKQLSHVAAMHGVDRQRAGDLPPVRVKKLNGDELILHADGLMAPSAPTYRVVASERGSSINITARTRNEAIRMVQGVAKKYPNVDASAVLAGMTMSSTPNEEVLQLQLQVGGPKAGRSIVKTALAMAHAIGIRHEQCGSIVSFLRGDDTAPPYGPFYERDIVRPRSEDHLLNCVAIDADPQRQLALAYVEYFGVARYIVTLSETYSGPKRHQVYAIDPSAGTEISVDVDLALSPEELQRANRGEGCAVDGYIAAANMMMPILLRRAESRAWQNTLRAAFEGAAKQMGIKDGDMIEASQAQEFSRLVAQAVTPYLLALQRRTRKGVAEADTDSAVPPAAASTTREAT